MISIFLLISLLLSLYLASFLVTLFNNYLAARKTKLPLVVCPIDPNHLIWMIACVPVRPILKRLLPYPLYARVALTVYGWEVHEKRIPFKTLNVDTFILVTCGKNELWTVDPEVVSDVLKRAGEFDKGEIVKVVAGAFGQSLFTAHGEVWSKQRRLFTSIINERISKVVFEETWRQGRMLVEDISKEEVRSSSQRGSTEGVLYQGTFPSMKRIASNVLFKSAYGLSREFESMDSPNAAGHKETVDLRTKKMNLLECINAATTDMITAATIPTKILLNLPSWMPFAKHCHQVGAAMDQFPRVVRERLDEERKALREEGGMRNNITSMMIQASEFGEEHIDMGDDESDEVGRKRRLEKVKEMEKTQQQKKHQPMLSEDELRGNLFVFTIAGFETTANAMTYALVSLMVYPEIQDWICEEIDMLSENVASDDDIEYAAFYPKAIRCQALMMEVLRLFPPIVHLPRSTPRDTPSIIKTSKQTITIPANSHIYVPFLSLHTDPQLWRNLNLPNQPPTTSPIEETLEDVFAMTQDEYQFRPSRWISPDLKQMPDGSMAKTLFQPPKGTFTPFAGGPRVCPGQKMAQVEFVSVMLSIFKDYHIEAAKLPGEDDTQRHERLKGVLRDSHVELTMIMDRLNEIDVRFMRRFKT